MDLREVPEICGDFGLGGIAIDECSVVYSAEFFPSEGGEGCGAELF
jgi:hypothetical protein